MKTRVGIAILLVICAIGLLWLIKDKNEKKVNIREAPPVVEPTKSASAISKQTPSSDKPIFQIKAECKPLRASFKKASYQWDEQINEYIYSKRSDYDEDLMVKAATLNKPLAFLGYEDYLFQRNYRKSEEAKELSSHRRIVRKEFPDDYFNGQRINWSAIEKLPETESNKFLVEYQPDIESIIELIFRGGEDKLIATAISHTPNLSRNTYGSSHQVGNNIFDALIHEGKSSLLDQYIALRGEIQNAEYGVNSLEKLIYYTDFESLRNKSRVIKVATNLGLKVRYQVIDEKLVSLGQFHTLQTRLSESDFEKYRSLGFMFKRAKTVKDLREDALVLNMKEKLDEAKLKFIKAKLNIVNLDRYKYCESVESLAKDLLSNSSVSSELSKTFELYKDDLDQLRNKLFDLEPGLNDCYLHPELNLKQKEPKPAIAQDKLSQLLRMFNRKDIIEAIEAAKSSNLNDLEKSMLFWQVTTVSPDQARQLLDNGFYPIQEVSLSAGEMRPELFSLLREYRFDFNISGKYERTLVEAAASKCNFDLIDSLYAAGYQYQSDVKRADALAIAIRYKNCYPFNASTRKKVELIKSIMQFKPEIMDYHRKRMAELRLSDMEAYRAVVNAFPQLSISDSVKPTGAICSQVRFPNGDLANLPLHF